MCVCVIPIGNLNVHVNGDSYFFPTSTYHMQYPQQSCSDSNRISYGSDQHDSERLFTFPVRLKSNTQSNA